MAKKLSKAERKAMNAQKKRDADAAKQETHDVEERDLGYDADFYRNDAGEEVEAIRPDFVIKPAWYADMFRAGEIHYRADGAHVLASDGQWYIEKDTACMIFRHGDGCVELVSDKDAKANGWTRMATSTSHLKLSK